MSSWVYVKGLVEVSVPGRTQPEIRYILDTVLSHLPDLYGSEGGMKVHAVKRDGMSLSSNHDEFGNYIPRRYWDDDNCREIENSYFLVLEANLRDAYFEQTYRELQNYLCRLAKRVRIDYLNVDIYGHSKSWKQKRAHIDRCGYYYCMYERPSWLDEDSKNWCEYLMWKHEDIPECYK